jgi:hypothetical protein
MAQVRLKEPEHEPCATAAMHGVKMRHVEGDELHINGRLALFHNMKCVGLLGGESIGRRSDAKSKKRYVYLTVTPKTGGGHHIELGDEVPKSVVAELSLNKRIHHEKSLRLFEMPGKVRGERCQLITL